MAKDLVVIFQAYVILWGVQMLIWPWLFRFGEKLSDRGWAAGRTLFTLILALLVWFGALMKIPMNNQGVTAVLIILAGLTWLFQKKSIKPALAFAKKHWLIIIFEEGLFLFGFVFYSLIRGYQPEILGLEKFMDFGFIRSYLASSVLPAPDMWFAGENINYYSFGHFWASIMTRVFGTAPEIAYNLIFAFILASGMALVFSIVINLAESDPSATLGMTKKKVILGGLLSSFLVIWGGNSHTIWSLISKGTLSGYWYADATRFIHNTIHEFPAYSFVVSDLHAHVLGFPVVLTFILMLIAWHKSEKNILIEIMIGILIGVMVMTNTWDGMIYTLLLIIYGFLMLVSGNRKFISMLRTGLFIGAASVITAIPWVIGFDPISKGVAPVKEGSPLWQLGVLWGLHLIVTLSAVAMAVRKSRRSLLVIALGLTSICLILIPEFIYVRDIYPSHPRANTMFKLTYQAIILMGILFGWAVIQVASIKYLVFRVAGIVGLLLVFGALMIFPFISFRSYYGGFGKYKGLDGFSFLKERLGNDLKLIRYLEGNRDGRNMIEAVGDSYTETDFVSAFSGVPTVIGWRVHEWLWRGGYDPVSGRDEEVRKFYEEGSLLDNKELIKKYDLGWIVVSGREREKYKNINEKKLKSLGKVVWTGGEYYLVKIPRLLRQAQDSVRSE